jgi:predicted nucleotidyltransferase
LGAELTKIFNAALSTGHLARFIVFGSFVTAKEKPNDIDIFLMMDDEFETTHKKRMAASFDFHLIPDEVRKNQIGCPHLALLN